MTVDGILVTKTAFAPTEVMSTYLLAFIVSDFGFIEQIDNDLQVIIFSQGLQRKLSYLAHQANLENGMCLFTKKFHTVVYTNRFEFLPAKKPLLQDKDNMHSM